MVFSSFFNILASTSFLLEPTMIFSFADKSYFAASSLLEQFCLSAENMNAEFWWQCHNSRRKSPGFIWWRREPIGCRQQSCIIFYVCFSLNYSRIYLCLFVSVFLLLLFSASPCDCFNVHNQMCLCFLIS